MKIFLDAGACLGILNANDALHERCRWLFAKVEADNPIWFTSWDVIDEVATKVSYFMDKETAIYAVTFLQETTTVVYVDQERAKRATELFTSYESKRISMTDCINTVLFRELSCDWMFSFDSFYRRESIELLESKYD